MNPVSATTPHVAFPGRLLPILGESADVASLENTACHLAENSALIREWLIYLAADPVRMTEVAARSYWHANGFAKLVLHVSDSPDFRIRMHVWPEGEGRGEQDPHSHRWNFSSVLLCGDGLDVSEWMEDSDGVSFIRHDYSRGQETGAPSMLVAGPKVGLRVAPYRRVNRSYTTVNTTVHTVRPVGKAMLATLVVQGPHLADTTVVYRPTVALDVDQPEIAPSCARELIRGVVNAMDPR